MKSKLYKDEKYLRHLHEVLHLTPPEIAKMFDVSSSLIYLYFKKFNIVINKEFAMEKNRKYKCDFEYFKIIDTPTKAYWLGFIMADGNIDNRKDRPNTHRLTIKLSSIDESHLEKFNRTINSNYPITPVITVSKGKEYRCSQLRINSSVFCRYLMFDGVRPKKSCSEIFPKNIIPKEYWKDFLRGVFDGDGSFSWWFKQDEHIPKCSFSLCGSKQLLTDCFNYIKEELNIEVPSILEHENGLYTATIGGNFQVIKLMKWLYNGNEKLDRKCNTFKEFLKEYNNPKYDEYKRKSNVYI